MSMDPAAGAEKAETGLIATLRRIAGQGLELVQLRIELLSTEIEAEKLRLFAALTQILLGLLLVIAAVGMLSVSLILLCPEPWRWLGALGLACAYAVAGGYCWRRASAQLSQPGGAFAGTVAELARDREAF
jgi:uncharacterized membrane protein YqjE